MVDMWAGQMRAWMEPLHPTLLPLLSLCLDGGLADKGNPFSGSCISPAAASFSNRQCLSVAWFMGLIG